MKTIKNPFLDIEIDKLTISPFCIALLIVPFSKITSFPVWFWLVQVKEPKNVDFNVHSEPWTEE